MVLRDENYSLIIKTRKNRFLQFFYVLSISVFIHMALKTDLIRNMINGSLIVIRREHSGTNFSFLF